MNLFGDDKNVYPKSILYFYFEVMLNTEYVDDIIYFANNYLEKIYRELAISE